MRIIIGIVIYALLCSSSYSEHSTPALIGLYQKTDKLSAFVPHCGHGDYSNRVGSFFVIASKETLKNLGRGFKPGSKLTKFVAVKATYTNDTKVGYDGSVIIHELLETLEFKSGKLLGEYKCT